MISYQLDSVDQSSIEYLNSISRLLALITALRNGLDDAITINQLKVLCEAIFLEIETSNLLRKHVGNR